MGLLIELSEALAAGPSLTGAKAVALSSLISEGFCVPSGICLTTEAFRRYLLEGNLTERILLEVNRKEHGQMRWEEMWDTALRIRGLFSNTPLPLFMEEELAPALEDFFGHRPVVVRSSSTVEDSEFASHAGLHESFINVRGARAIMEHMRLVWASLWSDVSLLYSKETGFDPDSDAMAVIIQELVDGEKSGVVFTADPGDPGRVVIESVHGLNKGLVDGDVEPDRWLVHRGNGKILDHTEPLRDRIVTLSGEGVALTSSGGLSGATPLSGEEVQTVLRSALDIEALFGSPQDVEWTFREGELYILQSRPITTLDQEEPARGSRAWNLTLKGSFRHLEELRERIEKVHFPAMEKDASDLVSAKFDDMDDRELASEIRRREDLFKHWTDIYWDEFIPMAHGVRMFGQIYNDVMQPSDPFQFVELLRQTPMLSTRRNAALRSLAAAVKDDPTLERSLEAGVVPERAPDFTGQLEDFLCKYGDLSWSGSRLAENLGPFLKFLVTMSRAAQPQAGALPVADDPEDLAEKFIARYTEGPEAEARRVLDLGRASWRLRDDDNIYLGRIEGQLQAAVSEGLARLAARGLPLAGGSSTEMVAAALEGKEIEDEETPRETSGPAVENVRARQIVGQPAGKGLAHGVARIVKGFEDLAAFSAGEVLVCDAIDPNMTLLVPMASAIVERRGGMLIHGAIIARESGIPCVNGVPDATSLIHTGDSVTVDGYLGLVIVHG